jgi:hypothetical protein
MQQVCGDRYAQRYGRGETALSLQVEMTPLREVYEDITSTLVDINARAAKSAQNTGTKKLLPPNDFSPLFALQSCTPP